MALSRFILPFADVGSGIKPSSGAELFFYETGTNVLQDTFNCPDGTTANSNPVISDSSGLFPDIFTAGTYKVVLKDKNGSQRWEADPVFSGSSSNIQSIARSLNVLDSQVIDALDTNTVLDNVLYIYNSSTQETWSVPPLNGGGETILSVAGDQLETTGGTYTLVSIDLTTSYVFDSVQQMTQSPMDFPIGKVVDTSGYYQTSDSGNARYLVKTLAQSSTDGDVIDEIVNFTLASSDVAILQHNGEIDVLKAGAFDDEATNSSPAFNAIIQLGFTPIFYGKYRCTDQIRLKTVQSMKGGGYHESQILWDGLVGVPCLVADGADLQNGYFGFFSVRGFNNVTTLDLIDATTFRYSTFDHVQMLYAKTCMTLTEAWGNTFTKCHFSCGGYSGVKPAGSVGLNIPHLNSGADVANLCLFTGCEFNVNETAVRTESAGRDVVFTGCGIEGNTIGFLFIDLGFTINFIIEECYLEDNTIAHIKIDHGFGSRDDRIVIRNNYVQVVAGSEAGLVSVTGSVISEQSLVVENNTLELLEIGDNPTNNYVVWFEVNSEDFNFTYESNIPVRYRVVGITAIKHFDQELIYWNTCSSNIPYKPVYIGGFSGVDSSQDIKIYCRNGMATITGTAVNVANATSGWVDVAALSGFIRTTSTVYPLTALQESAFSQPTFVGGRVSGTAVGVYFGSVNEYAAFSGSFPLTSGDYL